MKIARTVAVVVGTASAIALVATGVGAPLGAGIMGATWGTIAAGAAIVGSIAGMAMKHPSLGGSQGEWSADPHAGTPYVVGRTHRLANIIRAGVSGHLGQRIAA